MEQKTGQASLEQLIVIGLALSFVVISFYLASAYSTDSLRISQGQDAVERISAGVDYVYTLGPNSRDYVTVFMPDDIRLLNISGTRMVMTVGTTSGQTDIYANTKANLVGALPTTPGRQKVLIQYLPDGTVSIGEAGLACTPVLITRTLNASQSASDTITITNNAQFNVSGITANVTGGAGMIFVSVLPPNQLSEGQEGTMGIGFDVPANQPTGIYAAYAAVSSGNDGSCITQITLAVAGTSSCSALCASQGYSSGSCRADQSACVSAGEDYFASFNSSCSGGSPSCCCGPTVDVWGPLVTSMNHTPQNASASQNITISAVCNDTSTGGSFIQYAQIQMDGGTFENMSVLDGALSDEQSEDMFRIFSGLSPGQHVVGARCTDTANNTGPLAYYYFNLSMADIAGPIIVSLTHSDPYPTTLADILENGTATEEYTGNNDVVACNLKIDSGDWMNVSADDGAYDSVEERFSYQVGQLDSGLHSIYAYCVDGLGNVGGIYNDTFGVTAADIMLILDESGSMDETIVNAQNNSVGSTTSASWTLVKTLPVTAKTGDLANVSAELQASTSGCTVQFEARVGSDVIASGSRTSTSYGTVTVLADISAASAPYTVDLYLLKNYSGSCTARNRNFRLVQGQKKMDAAENASKIFVDISSNSTQEGLVSFATTATTRVTMMTLGSEANRTALKNAIAALSPTTSTCIQCGLTNAVNELISSRSRFPEAVRVAVLLTDGQGNVGNSVTGATYARQNNVTVYTIGFGDDVNVTELENIALLTNGAAYFAYDYETLAYIFQHIGQ